MVDSVFYSAVGWWAVSEVIAGIGLETLETLETGLEQQDGGWQIKLESIKLLFTLFEKT